MMAIRDWPIPRSVYDIQAFLEFTGFYRRFIKGYSKITTSLTERTKGNQSSSFQLNISELSAFRRLQVLFTQEPLLRHFDSALPIRVEPDASAYAIGAVLIQLHQGRWHPVAYLLKKLQNAELRYNTPKAELFAIVHAFNK
jgi:hypothetical protein